VPELKISRGAADRLGLTGGESVRFSTLAGTLEAPVLVDDAISDNRVLYSNNFRDNGVRGLLKFKIDRITKAPGIEGCEVTIEKMQEN
jgi:predicted molibdopterin-dependent oxidoreductase YjgC